MTSEVRSGRRTGVTRRAGSWSSGRLNPMVRTVIARVVEPAQYATATVFALSLGSSPSEVKQANGASECDVDALVRRRCGAVRPWTLGRDAVALRVAVITLRTTDNL